MFRTGLVVHHQEDGIIYCITHTVQSVQSVQSCRRGYTRLQDCTDCTELCNTVYYAVLLMMNDWIRSKHVEQIKNCGIKIDYKNCASRWSLTLFRHIYRQVASHKQNLEGCRKTLLMHGGKWCSLVWLSHKYSC